MPNTRSTSPYHRALEASSSRRKLADLGVATAMATAFITVVGVSFLVFADSNFQIPAQLADVATGSAATVLSAR